MKKIAMTLAAAAALGLAGCEADADRETAEDIDNALEAAGEAVENAAEATGEAVENAAAATAGEVSNAADEVQNDLE